MVQSMIDAHYWATHVMLDGLAQLTPEQYTQEIQSSFPSIKMTAAHMLNSERFLLGSLLGERLPRLEIQQTETTAGLREAWGDTEQRWRQTVAELDEAGLARQVTVRFSTGQSFELRAWQVIHQLIVHGPYHRGQVITLLHQVGAKPFKTDPLFYHIRQLSP